MSRNRKPAAEGSARGAKDTSSELYTYSATAAAPQAAAAVVLPQPNQSKCAAVLWQPPSTKACHVS